MANKKSFLVVLMIGLVGLSGCWRKRRVEVIETAKTPAASEKIYTRDVNLPVAEDQEFVDDTVSNFFDQDLNELVTRAEDDQSNDELALFDDQYDEHDEALALVEPSLNQEESLKTVYFDFDKHKIRKDQQDLVAENIEHAKTLLENSGAKDQATLVFEGHSDEVGNAAYNLALSEKRAKEVAERFSQAGISNIKVVGRGKDMPVIATGTKEELNRRVEMHIIYS